MAHHRIEYLALRHRLSRHLRVRILLWVVERDRMRMGYTRSVPGGMVGRVGIEGGGISSCVHECDAVRE